MPKKEQELPNSKICTLDLKNPQVAKKLKALKPYLVTGLFAWPTFWLYRGLMWSSQRDKKSISNYIKTTHSQAKLVQYVLIGAGLLVTTLSSKFKSPEVPDPKGAKPKKPEKKPEKKPDNKSEKKPAKKPEKKQDKKAKE